MEKVRIAEADFLVGGAVYEKGILQGQAAESIYVRAGLSLFQQLTRAGKVNSFRVNDILHASGNAADFQHLAGAPGDGLGILLNHLHQGFPHAAVTGDEHRHHLLLVLVKEDVVDGTDGFLGPGRGHNDGDIPLRRTLCRGADRNAVAAQGGQHLARGAAVAQDVVSDHAHDGKAGLHLQGIQLAQRNLVGKAVVGRLPRLFRIGRRDGDAHRMHGRGLGDEDDVDALAVEGVEQAGAEARDPHHSAAFQRDEGDALGVGQADDPAFGLRGILLHQRAGILRVEGILHVDGNALGHHRLDGGRIDDFGAEVGKFLRGAVGDVGNGAGRRRHLRVGRHDAGHIRPDFLAAGVDAHGKEGGGVVRSSAAQRGGTAFLVAGNEARNHEQLRVQMLLHALLDALVGDGGVHRPTPHYNQFAGVQPLTRDAQRLEFIGKNTGRQEFAETLHGGQAGRGELGEKIDSPQDAGELGEGLFHRLHRLGLAAFGKEFPDNLPVPLLQGLQALFVTFVSHAGQPADGNELIRAAADGRTHHDGAVCFQGLADNLDHLEHGVGAGDGTASEFENLHS